MIDCVRLSNGKVFWKLYMAHGMSHTVPYGMGHTVTHTAGHFTSTKRKFEWSNRNHKDLRSLFKCSKGLRWLYFCWWIDFKTCHSSGILIIIQLKGPFTTLNKLFDIHMPDRIQSLLPFRVKVPSSLQLFLAGKCFLFWIHHGPSFFRKFLKEVAHL